MTAPNPPNPPKPQKPEKPLSKGGKVFFWIMIVFFGLAGVLGGVALITQGLDGRDAVADGPAGTLTPTDRECGKDYCRWIGEFVSDDGTVTRTGVELYGAEDFDRTDPMPTRIDNVRLHDDEEKPTAYPTDYNPVPKIVGGVFLILFTLVAEFFLIRMMRRYKRRLGGT